MRISSSLLAGIALLSVSGSLPAQAEEAPADSEVPSDQTITVTATRQPVAVEDAPVTVTVIDERRIADELASDIKDLVRFEPGISVPRSPTRFGAALGVTGRAGNEGFVIRGMGGNRVLIQIDGVRVPDGFTFGAQSAGRGDYVDLGLVKSVEILRGPASALYGSDGLAGAVSFITTDPADFLAGGKSIGGLVRAAYSSADNEFSETAVLAGRAGSVSVMGAYTRRDYNELENMGVVGGTGSLRTIANPQDGESNAFLGRIVWEPGGGHKLRVTGEYIDTSLFTEVLTGRSATVELLEASDTGKRKRIAADWIWEGTDSGIDYARVSAYWQDAEDIQFTDEDRTPAADRERLNTFENRAIGASAELRAGFETGTVGHRFILGGDISRTTQQGLRDGVVPPAGDTFPTRAFPVTDYTLAGAFVADEMSLGPVTLYPALRLDYYSLSPENDPLLPTFAAAKQHGSRLSPKLGAVVKASDTVRFFASYAQGFKSPAPSQVNNFFENPAQGYKSIANPNLRPETSNSFEAGVRFNNALVSVDLTGFHAKYDKFIDQIEITGQASPTPATPWIYQWVNLTGAEIRGAEARVSVRPGSGVSATLAVSYADGDGIGATGAKTPLQSVDPLKAVLGVGYDSPGNRFGGKLIATYGGQKEIGETLGSSCYPTPASTPACFTGDDYFVLDLTAYVRVLPELTIRAGLFNLTDRKYWMWSDFRGLGKSSAVKDAYTQPGRNGSVSISYRF
jgi:hemoglobin/transferrin/lactoferrin receptor protein